MIAIAAVSFSASAQTQKSDDMKPGTRESSEKRSQQRDRINSRILEQLSLSATQKEQITSINYEYRTKMQEMIKSEIPAEERKNKRTAFETEKRNKILAILTTDQTKKLKELQSSETMGMKDDKGESIEKIKSDDGKTKIKRDDEKTKIKIEND